MPSREQGGSLSEAEMVILSKLKNRVQDEAEGLPPISEHCYTLLQSLKLEGTSTPTGTANYTSRALLMDMVDAELSCLTINCLYQTPVISNWLRTQFKYIAGGVDNENSATAGAITVIKALHLYYGPAFIDEFSKLDPKDLYEALNQQNRPVNDRHSLLSNAIGGYRLPAYQSDLALCLNKVSDISFVPRATLDGGIAMFRVLEILAHKMDLKPPK